MSKETVEIDVKVLTQQVNDGMKKDALAKHYGISVVQMGRALKDAELKIRKFHKPVFKLVGKEDLATTDVANTTDNVQTNVQGDVNNGDDSASTAVDTTTAPDSPTPDSATEETPEAEESTTDEASNTEEATWS